MCTNQNLIYLNRFVFGSIPRLFVCLRMRMSSSQQYANVYVKSIFLYPGSIAGVPFDSARRFRPTLLLHTTYVRSWCTLRASCVAAFNKKQKSGLSEGLPILRSPVRFCLPAVPCNTVFCGSYWFSSSSPGYTSLMSPNEHWTCGVSCWVRSKRKRRGPV